MEELPDSEGSQPPNKRARVDDGVSKPEENNVEESTPEDLDNGLQPISNDSQLEPTEVNDPTQNPEGEPTGRTDSATEKKVRNPESQQDPKSSQHSHPAENIINIMKAELSNATANDIDGELFCFQAMFPNYAGEPEQDPLTVFKATSDPNTMYMHEAMKEKDAKVFRKAMQKEWDDQFNNGNFTIVHRSEVPEGATVLPAVWQMKRKRDIMTRQIKKYKARLNLDGSKMKQGQHYDQTYAPVATQNSIRTMLILAAYDGWYTRQIDYVLAFPQAPIDREIYMKVPAGFTVVDGNNKDYVLKLHRNVYGGKAASRTFYQYLSQKLIEEVGFTR